MTKKQLIALIGDPIYAVELYRIQHGIRVEDLVTEAGVRRSTYYATTSGETTNPRWEHVYAIMQWRLAQ